MFDLGEIPLPPELDGYCGSCLIEWHEVCDRGKGEPCACVHCAWYHAAGDGSWGPDN